MDQNQNALALSINDETVDIHGIGVDVCKNIPYRHIIPAKIHRLHEAITADILHSAGFQKHEAEKCFKAIRERISSNQPLRHSTLDQFEGMGFLRQHSSKILRIHAGTKKIVCPPAHVMGCVIAAVAYRKLQPAHEGFFQENKDVVKVFGELNGIQWLSVAIQVWDKVRSCAFVIELDENNENPVAEIRTVNGASRWVVTTRMPDMNKYESVLRNAFCPAVQPSGPTVPKLESDDNLLPSVEPNDATNEPIPMSDDDETEDNTFTLRDFTRQMKTLGKRLATPDRAIARHARREIMKKPDQVGQQEVGALGPPKEYFDSYTHFKDVWKTCLQNRVSIPNSLRVLVDHHCTPSQVFHLMELEKEHLAEMEMEIDG
ncbi:uncharacterized protein FSUBG_2254 [Fusarium subglutinans]|uniref:Uncharacterized protein n=1 Tax=Gibberella subglutinans TaxID=42677 RepID=A0A8H5QCI7_GIBSU|nr:uncharacterized protein FSUBG_2254 [Fusarium subglutinans]KAF5611421.1 hypothetical protein FSUBG_2254 [Fusarium subglutinans]